jgi:hypothetical protein
MMASTASERAAPIALRTTSMSRGSPTPSPNSIITCETLNESSRNDVDANPRGKKQRAHFMCRGGRDQQRPKKIVDLQFVCNIEGSTSRRACRVNSSSFARVCF